MMGSPTCKAKMSTGIFEVASIQGVDFVANALTIGRSEGTTIVKNPDFSFIAKVVHNVTRAYSLTLGNESIPKWEDMDVSYRPASAFVVRQYFTGAISLESDHEAWLKNREADGWKYGPVHDVEKKETPHFLPYAQLPEEKLVRDLLFKAVVDSFK